MDITGHAINVILLSTITGLSVSFTDTAGITIAAQVTGTNGVSSTGPSTFMITSTGALSTTNAPVTITHTSGGGGLVTINGPISAGTGTVAVSGLGVTTGSTGTIGGGSVTLAGDMQTSPSPGKSPPPAPSLDSGAFSPMAWPSPPKA